MSAPKIPRMTDAQIDAIGEACSDYDDPAYFRVMARAVEAVRDQQWAERVQGLEEDLRFVERWANHHGAKPTMTAQEALSCIQHYPAITAITRGYADGKVPDTFDPYAKIAELERALDVAQGALDTAIPLVRGLYEPKNAAIQIKLFDAKAVINAARGKEGATP